MHQLKKIRGLNYRRLFENETAFYSIVIYGKIVGQKTTRDDQNLTFIIKPVEIVKDGTFSLSLFTLLHLMCIYFQTHGNIGKMKNLKWC